LQNRTAAFQKCLKGHVMVVVLPAFEVRESQRLDLHIVKIHAFLRRRRHARRRDQAEPKTETNEVA
jgi:hypothetical protein